MKENVNLKIIIKVICFFAIGIMLLQLITKIVIPKWITVEDNRMTYIIKGFYEEPKNSLDVIFMGNSDVYRGISPITMWDEYGIVSYNFVSSGQRMWTAYYMLEEALKYQKPKLIVLNMDSAFNESHSSESNYRKVFDNMKLSKNKIEAITDPAFGNSKNDILSYIFPVTRYHSRWSELKETDFLEAYNNSKFPYKGMDLTTVVEAYIDECEYMNKDHSNKVIGKKNAEYLDKIVKVCKEKNIQLLLIELPSADSWSQDLSNKTIEFANKYDLEFIDMNLNFNEFGFDWKTDTSDGGDHLNVYGAEKVSKYLGKIIQEKYNISNRKNEVIYEEWNKDSETYHNDKKTLEENNL